MRSLQLAAAGEHLSVLCLGAHSDDIEIGVGATLLTMIERGVHMKVHWCVLSGVGDREQEARRSAADFLSGAAQDDVEILWLKKIDLPATGGQVKSCFEGGSKMRTSGPS